MVAAILERTGARSCTTAPGANMAGGVASALAARLAPRRPRARRASSGCSRSTSSGSAPVVEELEPRALLLAQPVPRPARPLRRARDHRRALGGRRRRARAGAAALVLNADDPLVADLGRGARRALLRRRGRRARARRAPARRRLQALPPLRASLRLRRDLPRATSAATLPELRRAPARAGRRGARRRAARHPLGRVHARTPAGSARVELPLPGLYNVYNALGAAALCLAARARRSTRSSRGLRGGRAGVRAGRDASTSAGAPTSILLVKNPAGRERGAAHARARGRASSTCSAC